MKVMCIDASSSKLGRVLPPKGLKLIEGEVYHVLREVQARTKYDTYVPAYELFEFMGGGFERSRFVPVSDIDETEFVRNKKEEPV